MIVIRKFFFTATGFNSPQCILITEMTSDAVQCSREYWTAVIQCDVTPV